MLDRQAWVRIVPFALYMAFIVVADLLARWGVPAEQLRYLYGVKIALVLAALLYWRREYTELRGPWPGWRGMWLALAVGVLVLVLWVNLDAGWMQVGSSAGFDPRRDGRLAWELVVLRLAGAALVVPVMEELFWRSFLLRWIDNPRFLSLDPAHGSWRAFIVLALLFGVEHNLWLAGTVAGLAYGALYRYSRQLWLAVLAHAVTNGMLGIWIIVTGNWTYW